MSEFLVTTLVAKLCGLAFLFDPTLEAFWQIHYGQPEEKLAAKPSWN